MYARIQRKIARRRRRARVASLREPDAFATSTPAKKEREVEKAARPT